MNTEDTGNEKLFDEIDRYLAAVELFRATGCEPTWRTERTPDTSPAVTPTGPLRTRSDVELH